MIIITVVVAAIVLPNAVLADKPRLSALVNVIAILSAQKTPDTGVFCAQTIR